MPDREIGLLSSTRGNEVRRETALLSSTRGNGVRYWEISSRLLKGAIICVARLYVEDSSFCFCIQISRLVVPRNEPRRGLAVVCLWKIWACFNNISLREFYFICVFIFYGFPWTFWFKHSLLHLKYGDYRHQEGKGKINGEDSIPHRSKVIQKKMQMI